MKQKNDHVKYPNGLKFVPGLIGDDQATAILIEGNSVGIMRDLEKINSATPWDSSTARRWLASKGLQASVKDGHDAAVIHSIRKIVDENGRELTLTERAALAKAYLKEKSS